jgi:hypothetical protein
MMKLKFIFIMVLAAALLAGTASAAATQVAIGAPQGGAGTTVTIPVTVSGASNIGAMDLQVTYDPAVLKLSGAQMGTLSANGVVEANEPQAGTALVSFVDTQGISGSGEVVKITFNVLGTTGAYSPLTLQARAYDLDLKDVPVAAQSGSVTVGGGKSGIETAVIVLSVGIGAFFYGRRRN